MDKSEPRGAILLLLDLPPSSFCGIDLLSFQTSPKFKGIKQIPPGWHFLFTAVNDAFSIRYGEWFYVDDSATLSTHIMVKRWDAKSEQFADEDNKTSLAPTESYLQQIWNENLSPYRSAPPSKSDQEGEEVFDKDRDWTHLTDCLTKSILSRILGAKNSQECWSLSSANSAQIDADDIPGLGNHDPSLYDEKVLGFLPVDLKQTWRQGAIGRERTKAAQDRSWALENLVQKYCQKPEDVVGELQFSFIMVLTLNNNSCLEQWKRLLSLLLTCQKIVLEQSALFAKFLSCLKLQIEHSQDAEGGLFDLTEDGAPLLKSLLRRFRSGLSQKSGFGKDNVMSELEDLEDFLKLEYDWVTREPQVRSGMLQLEDGEQVQMDMGGFDEEDESGEYAPVVVNLTSEQATSLELEGSIVSARANGQTALEIDAGDESDEVVESSSDEASDPEDLDARY